MKTKFVAEVSSNHDQDLNRCKDFIKVCSQIGVDAVKFQAFKIDELFAPEVLRKREDLRKRKEWELPVGFIPKIAEYTHSLGMEFSCTPFYLDAVTELEPHVDFFKIASYELLWPELFKKCAATEKPLVISTGMATMTEIEAAIRWLKDYKLRDLTILHCSSAYPTKAENANLNIIETFRKTFSPYEKFMKLNYGWSDHTRSPGVVLKSIFKYQASFVEFHLDLDGKGAEYKSGHCWLPDEIERVIQFTREGEKAAGSWEKVPNPEELSDREWRADPSDGLRPLKHKRLEFQT